MLLYVLGNDNNEKLPVKQIANWTVFGEIQTATTTVIARWARFRLISRPFKNLHRIPTGTRNFVTYLCQLVFAAILWVKLPETFATGIWLKYALLAS